MALDRMGLVDQTSARWNRIVVWLRQLASLEDASGSSRACVVAIDPNHTAAYDYGRLAFGVRSPKRGAHAAIR